MVPRVGAVRAHLEGLRRQVRAVRLCRCARRSASLVCLVVVLALLAPLNGGARAIHRVRHASHCGVPGSSAQPGAIAPRPDSGGRARASGALGPSGRRVIVQLEAPPAVQAFGRRLPTDDGPGLSAELRAHLGLLEAEQDAASAHLAAAVPGGAVVERYRWVFHGMAVQLPQDAPQALDALYAIPGVRAVYDEVAYRPALYSSVGVRYNESINAAALWSPLGGPAGEGVRIAVLDNGIDISHPMFDASTFSYPSGYPLGDNRFTTAKVIVARAYVRPTDPPIEGEAFPIPGPAALGHGTHVAGVAAGLPVTATVNGLSLPLSGVAPRAHLMNYRIFYPSERTGLEEAYSVEVLRALEDAVADGADVLLGSWVSAAPRLPLATAEAAALEAAIEAGVVVVSAAGNDGPAYGSASRLLGGYPEAIAVGAVTKSPIVARNVLDVTGPGAVPEFLQGIPVGAALFGPKIDALFGPAPYTSVATIAGGAFRFACEPLPVGSLEGRIALVERGECPFADKVHYAQRAGAVAVVIQNTDESVFDFACAGAFCEPGDIGIPAVMVGRSAGDDMATWRAQHPTATLRIDPRARLVEARPGVVWESSARGPAFMRYLKPDVMAPGVAVLSATHDPSAGGAAYGQMTGTSVAAAHVAGAAALLLQANPGWGHTEVRSALMSTGRIDDLWGDAEALAPARVLDRGAGLIDVAAATAPPLLVEPPSVSLPEVRAGRSYTVPLVLTDVRASGEAITYTPSVSVTGMISVTLLGSISVAPGATVTATVRVTVNTAAGPGDATADLFLVGGGRSVHVPLWAQIAPPVAAADVLLIDNDFSIFSTFVDYAPVITRALETLPRYSYAYWNADARFDNPQTIPDLPTLRRYPVIIWLTGDNRSPYGTFVVDTPLTPTDLELLAAYLDGGGRLLAIGQNLAEASDVNPKPDPDFGRASLYHYYLGARWLQGNLFAGASPPREPSVVGVGASWMRQVALDLGPEGDGEGNQVSVDEIAPGGTPTGADLDLVRPILQGVGARALGAGYVGVAKWDGPTLEDREPDIPYRTIYFSFGVEGVNDRPGATTRAQLLERALDFMVDEVTVALLPTAAGVRDLTQLEARASSSVGAAIVRYRWLVTSLVEGSDWQQAASSVEPFIAVALPEPGDYVVAVEALDELGHTAVDEARVTAAPGGGSNLVVSRAEAAPGVLLEYRIVLRNTGPVTSTLAVSMTVPAGTAYVSHSGAGATFDPATNVLEFVGSLGPNTTREVRLTVRVGDVAPGTVIKATARFRADDLPFERRARTVVRQRTLFPVVARGAVLP